MLQSKLFYKTQKQTPKDAEAISHMLLVKAGFVDQLTAGIYSFLPLGFKVLKKIENIIRHEITATPINGQEILMPVLSPKENWQKTGRWESFDALFKLKGKNERDYVLNPTHEEIISPLAKKIILSHKDLPVYLFQIQTKFRDELRVKSGLLRTREFLMKDLYSFHATENDLDNYYEKVVKAYFNIYKRCGIFGQNFKNGPTYKTWASGGSFSEFSHEFQTITEYGEDIIYVCKKCGSAINKEIKEKINGCPNKPCKSNNFEEKKAVEVGNIFKLGTKYSLPFELKFKDKDGKEKPVIMGCYGVGLGRLMASVVEVNHDEKGIIWPKEIAPFLVHLITIENSKKMEKTAQKIYNDLQKKGIEVLYDDRQDKTAGEKFAESDLLGIPFRIVISEKTLKQNSVELKERAKDGIRMVKANQLVKFLIANL